MQAEAASNSKTAKDALIAKAESIAIKDAESGSVVPVFYGLCDINQDKVTEMMTAQGANTFTLKIYAYTSKVKKLATVKDVYDVHLDKKNKKIIICAGSDTTSKDQFIKWTVGPLWRVLPLPI